MSFVWNELLIEKRSEYFVSCCRRERFLIQPNSRVSTTVQAELFMPSRHAWARLIPTISRVPLYRFYYICPGDIFFSVFSPVSASIAARARHETRHETENYYDNYIFDKFPALSPSAQAANDRIPDNNVVSELFTRPINFSWTLALSRKIARPGQRPVSALINEERSFGASAPRWNSPNLAETC